MSYMLIQLTAVNISNPEQHTMAVWFNIVWLTSDNECVQNRFLKF